MKEPVQYLKEALNERIANNASYSMRAFARDLEISPQLLSNVFNGRKGLSQNMAAKLSQNLGLDPHQQEVFCKSVQAKFSRSKSGRTLAEAHLAHLAEQSGVTANLELDLFKIISSWYHYGLISLLKISKKKCGDTAWMGTRLGIPEGEVKQALIRLERLELVTKTEKGWKVNQDTVIADQGISTEAVKHFHRQILERALQAMAFQGSDERYGSSSTLPIQVKDLPRAKKLIQEFRLNFSKEIADPKNGDEVYGLSMQFFRLTQKSKERSL